MQGFKKVDPDRWEFANECFLGGQKHLLKTIRRRRNVVQPQHVNQQQQGGGPFVELGHYGTDEELERLRRDRKLLMAEIVKLKQQQQNSRERIMAMEGRIQGMDRKQQQIMSFLAKIFRSPSFLKQYMDKYDKMSDKHIEIGQKRRLTMSPSDETLGDCAHVAAISDQNLNQEGPVDGAELEVETLLSAAFDDGSSSEAGVGISAEIVPSASETNMNPMIESIWERFFSDDMTVGDEVEEDVLAAEPATDVEVEELVAAATSPVDLQDIVDQLGFL